MAGLKTFSSVQIAEHLEKFNMSVSHQELKNINTDLLQNIYLTLLYDLNYESEHMEMAGNFEAVNELECKEDYDEIIPHAHFCLILKKVFHALSDMEVTHFDFFSPKWKDQRSKVSLILNYCLYAEECKEIYEEVCNEFVDACVSRKDIQDDISKILDEINNMKILISRKKFDDKIVETYEALGSELETLAVVTEQTKANSLELKRALEEVKLEEEEMLKELELIEKENSELEKFIVKNPEEAQVEVEEIKGQINSIKLQINHKKVEDADLENKYIVNAAKNAPLPFTSALPRISDHFNTLETEVSSVRGQYESHKSYTLKRIVIENKIKEQTKTLARLREEKVALASFTDKQKIQIEEAMKDKVAELEELKNQVKRKHSQSKAKTTTRKNQCRNEETENWKILEGLEKKTKHVVSVNQFLQDQIDEFKESEILRMEQVREAVEKERNNLYSMVNKYTG